MSHQPLNAAEQSVLHIARYVGWYMGSDGREGGEGLHNRDSNNAMLDNKVRFTRAK